MVPQLRVRVVRGSNLVIRDLKSSDPYVILSMGRMKLKTRVIKKNINPVWNEDLTLPTEDHSSTLRVEVFDKDAFTKDDFMGYAEVDIRPLVEAANKNLRNIPDGKIITKLVPSEQNFLSEESDIYLSKGKVLQDLVLRLQRVEYGEIVLQLQWITKH